MKKDVIRIELTGIVQGVGFRPFIHRLATKHNLNGYVRNSTKGVTIVAEGKQQNIDLFLKSIKTEKPPMSKIEKITISTIKYKDYKTFKIIKSKKEKEEFQFIPPDISICDDCKNELLNENNRRYKYPFINCTNCGPRFTIIKDIPYDRAKTTMKEFKMCKDCLLEYKNIKNRRYHAEPNACAVCGPEVKLIRNNKKQIATSQQIGTRNDVITTVIKLLKKGGIVAIKGIGGYHLACDATNTNAVKTLKKRKSREDKPLAIMSFDIKTIGKYCCVNKIEKKLLESPQRPIVLLRKKPNSIISNEVAKNHNYLGVMLPYSPLHYLLLNNNIIALVMTSANYSDEPLTKDDNEAFSRLSGIADYFLIHNRKINIRCDDSVLKIVNNKPMFIRRSRGYVPMPIHFISKKQILGVGAELKNTFCLTKNNFAFMSQHIGDLKNMQTYEYYKETIDYFKKFFRIKPEIIACDMHPDYLSTKYAKEQSKNVKVIETLHYHSHIASCLVDNNVYKEPIIGVAFDGTGYGTDGNIWGGEFLICDLKNWERVAHLRYVPMPGGDIVVKKPYRMAISYVYNSIGKNMPSKIGNYTKHSIILNTIKNMIDKKINSPLTSSCGRLFDAVSYILGISEIATYEAQPAIELEMTAEKGIEYLNQNPNYKYQITKENEMLILDWQQIIKNILEDIGLKKTKSFIAIKFHNTIASAISEICLCLREKTKINKVALSGGVFQNKILSELTYKKLTHKNFVVYQHKQVPPNDGGISLGQAAIASNI